MERSRCRSGPLARACSRLRGAPVRRRARLRGALAPWRARLRPACPPSVHSVHQTGLSQARNGPGDLIHPTGRHRRPRTYPGPRSRRDESRSRARIAAPFRGQIGVLMYSVPTSAQTVVTVRRLTARSPDGAQADGARPTAPGRRGQADGARPTGPGRRGQADGARPTGPGRRGQADGARPTGPGRRGQADGARPTGPGRRGQAARRPGRGATQDSLR
jgi:hypothetical protein